MARNDASDSLLFGLLALQNGLIDQAQLVAAFQAWTRDRGQPLADRYPSCRFNQACSLALMVPVAAPDRREAIATQAIATVRQAFAAGYANTENLRVDPDLDAIRERPDFQAFLDDKLAKAGAGG